MADDLADIVTPEESEAHEVRRLRWILRVSEMVERWALIRSCTAAVCTSTTAVYGTLIWKEERTRQPPTPGLLRYSIRSSHHAPQQQHSRHQSVYMMCRHDMI